MTATTLNFQRASSALHVDAGHAGEVVELGERPDSLPFVESSALHVDAGHTGEVVELGEWPDSLPVAESTESPSAIGVASEAGLLAALRQPKMASSSKPSLSQSGR